MRSGAFWVGCAVPLSVILFNIIGYFQPGSPQVPIHQGNPLQLIAGAPAINLMIYFPVVGFTYLVPTTISFRIWFFYLFNMVETGAINLSGVSAMRPDAYVWGWTMFSWQSCGAFTAMVLWSLWIGRRTKGCDRGKCQLTVAAKLGMPVTGIAVYLETASKLA